jgi:folate-binding protein YgfZ
MAVVEVQGGDSQRFLHAQLGIDVMALGGDTAPLGAWHDSSGRVRALFRIVRLDASWLLLLPRSQLASVPTQLARYVLRADVRINQDSAVQVAAVTGDASAWLAKHCGEFGSGTAAVAAAGEAKCIRLGARLHQLVGARDALLELGKDLESGTDEDAAVAEIELGLPCVEAEIAGLHLPQMLNLDRLGAMSFDKGCYPGQEIIARTHNLGSVKRRMRRFAAGRAAGAGVADEVASGDGTVVGSVVRAARDAEDTQLLAVVRLEALAAPLYLGGRQDLPLRELPLPY